MAQELKPVGQRPHCLNCNRELRPNFKQESPPYSIATGNMRQVRDPRSYGQNTWTYIEEPDYRSLTVEERVQFKKDHPPVFQGTYGQYRDNRFCSLRCGYQYAIRITGGR